MRILLPVQCIKPGKIGGVQQMIESLAVGFDSSKHDLQIVTDRYRPATLPDMKPHIVRQAVIPSMLLRGSRFASEQAMCYDPSLAGDMTIFPNYFTPYIAPRRLGHIVTVIHDLQYDAFPEYFSPNKRRWLRLAHKHTLAAADTVVVISDFVKRTVIETYGAKYQDKVEVIPNAISWDKFSDPADVRLPSRPYILSVASDFPHKNLVTLVRAFREVIKSHDVDLVLVGQLRENLGKHVMHGNGIAKAVAELDIQDRVHQTGFVSDSELAAWYKSSRLFAFPSRYEGFGMPPAEAIGLGVPVVASGIDPVKTVTRDLACYVVDPLSVDEWTSRLNDVLDDIDAFRPKAEASAGIRKTYDPLLIAERFADIGE